jgi:hypothetical protein
LSPFLLVADGLSLLLKKQENLGGITPLRVTRRAPAISHLLFVDVSLLFFRAVGNEAERVQEVLNTFERCTGQQVNPAKCSILFAEHCPQEVVEEVRQSLHVQQASFQPKYLGLPTPEGRMKSDRFQPANERLRKRLLNYGGLIKSVAQAIPTYIMSVFQLPEGVCKSMEQTIRRFWWVGRGLKRKTHWIAWRQLTLMKK